MYSKTREEARSLLGISTRSVDRYIRNSKLRSKKIWKIVYINENDINNFLWNNKQEVILNNQISNIKEEIQETKAISFEKKENKDMLFIFESLKKEIKNKDEEIKDLSNKLGKMQELLSNSIPILDYKKEQFLIEESKTTLNSKITNLEKDLNLKDIILKTEKKNNYVLLWVIILLFILLFVLWFVKI